MIKTGCVQPDEQGPPLDIDPIEDRDRRGKLVERKVAPSRRCHPNVPAVADSIVVGDPQEAMVGGYRPIGRCLCDEPGNQGVETGLEGSPRPVAGHATFTPFQKASRPLIAFAASLGSA